MCNGLRCMIIRRKNTWSGIADVQPVARNPEALCSSVGICLKRVRGPSLLTNRYWSLQVLASLKWCKDVYAILIYWRVELHSTQESNQKNFLSSVRQPFILRTMLSHWSLFPYTDIEIVKNNPLIKFIPCLNLSLCVHFSIQYNISNEEYKFSLGYEIWEKLR